MTEDLITINGLVARVWKLQRGEAAPKHVHDYDHMSVVASGFAAVTVDDITTEHGPGSVLTIAAGKTHHVKALTDVTWLCCHPDEK